MPDNYEFLLRKLTPRRLEKDAETYKVMDEVFDRSTLMVLYRLMNRGIFDELHGVVSTGKEANVFRASDCDGKSLAIKIYRISTSDFRTKWRYLAVDPRFQSIRRTQRHVVYAWAKREYKNLHLAIAAGVQAPKPLAVMQNVLAMEFLGEKGLPYPRMKDSPPENPESVLEKLLSAVRNLYREAKLVHADLSEYNVLVTPEPIMIDFSMATNVQNPAADEWLQRDVHNLIKYFRKLGANVREADEVLAEIRGE